MLDQSMLIVTTTDGTRKAGCLVGFSTQVSIEPLHFLVGLSVRNHTHEVASAATHLAVHVLAKEDLALARLFGEQTGDSVDKFIRCAWATRAGLPVLDQVRGWFAGCIIRKAGLGDHTGFLLAAEQGQLRAGTDFEPLMLSDVADFDAGHKP